MIDPKILAALFLNPEWIDCIAGAIIITPLILSGCYKLNL